VLCFLFYHAEVAAGTLFPRVTPVTFPPLLPSRFIAMHPCPASLPLSHAKFSRTFFLHCSSSRLGHVRGPPPPYSEQRGQTPSLQGCLILPFSCHQRKKTPLFSPFSPPPFPPPDTQSAGQPHFPFKQGPVYLVMVLRAHLLFSFA